MMKLPSLILTMALTCSVMFSACTSGGLTAPRSGGVTAKSGGTAGAGGAVVTGGWVTEGGAKLTGGTPTTTGGSLACANSSANVVPCGGEVTGAWTVTPSCLNVTGSFDVTDWGIGCKSFTVTEGSLEVTGSWTAAGDGKFTDHTTTKGTVRFTLAPQCLEISGTLTDCESISGSLASLGFESVRCNATADRGCACVGLVNHSGGFGLPSPDPIVSGNVKITGDGLIYPDDSAYAFCSVGNRLTLTPRSTFPTLTGSVVLQKGILPGTGGAGGAGGNSGSGGDGGAVITGGKPSTGGMIVTGGTPASTGGALACTNPSSNVVPCGGDVTGVWTVTPSCLKVAGDMDLSWASLGCATVPVTGSLQVSGTWTAKANGTYVDNTITTGSITFPLEDKCLSISSVLVDCSKITSIFKALGWSTSSCANNANGQCNCVATVKQAGGIGVVSPWAADSGTYTTMASGLSLDDNVDYTYCVSGNSLGMTPKPTFQPVTGTIALQKIGTGTRAEGPCDIYGADNTPCVAAYSMGRTLTKNYGGPLYQVRSGSSSTNTGTGGTVKDIGQTPDGYADTATQDTFCSGSLCTVAILYDQSGNGNDLKAGTKGSLGCDSNPTDTACSNDYESSATKGAIMIGGHKVYALYMNAHEGYRSALGVKGKNVPSGTVAQGIYELVDGTRFSTGTKCCWEFGNVTPTPTLFGDTAALFFGDYYGVSGAGTAPWFMADLGNSIIAGGSRPGDPGWPSLNDLQLPNPQNPSMKGVPFAFGILKTSASKYVLRAADLGRGAELSTAYEGTLTKQFNLLGGIVLGVGAGNSNSAYGTFYEGAITAGSPSNNSDLAVLKNLQAAGYSK